MCFRLFIILLFGLLQSLNPSQCVDMGNEEMITELVEKILAEKTFALSEKVLNLEEIVENQQTRINYLERQERRSERTIIGMKKILNDIQTELRSNRLDSFGENVNDAASYDSNTYADKYEKTEFHNARNTSMASKRITKTTRLSKRGNGRGIVKSRQRRVPEIVAFTAYLSHRIDHMGVGHHVVFDKILTNDGAGYNSKTGIFTVPVTGLYLFTYSLNDHYRKSMLQLVVDGSNIVDIIVDPDSSSEEAMSGNTAIIHVSQGQSVWIQEYYVNDGSIWSDDIGRYCTFSGVLLY